MLSDEEFLRFLNNALREDTLESRLMELLDEELEKPEDEMNTDFIEYCLDSLVEIEKKKQNIPDNEVSSQPPKIKLHKLRKILLIAAIIVVLIVGTLSASAAIFNLNFFDGIAEFYNDTVRVHYDQSVRKTTEEQGLTINALRHELDVNDFASLRLPSCFLTEQYSFSNVRYQRFDEMEVAFIEFVNNESKLSGYISITRYADAEMVSADDYINVKDFKKLSANGMDIYVFDQKVACSIGYIDSITQYDIVVSDDLDAAISIAKTIQ